MRIWIPWFLVWAVIGPRLLMVVLRQKPPHSRGRKLIVVALPFWLLFSGFAAEITRLYLAVYPLPAWACAILALGVAILGSITGLLAGWFVGGGGISRLADSAAGALGALIAAWAEITSSYNHAEYVIAMTVIGAAFFTFMLRCGVLRSRSETLARPS